MIKIQKGDLFQHLRDNCVVPHCVNNHKNPGQWGSGFVLAIDKNLGGVPKQDYLGWSKNDLVNLGSTRYTTLNRSEGIVTVAHMWAQHKTIREGHKPVRYAALVKCMENVRDYCLRHDKSIVAPMFCAGLAGGNWKFINELIEEIWKELDVTIFEL